MTEEKYIPLNSLGEILVNFREPVSEGFADTFGKFLGYDLLDRWKYGGGSAFVYSTGVHQEEQAINIFSAKTEFVEWSSRRDIALEGRWTSLEDAIAALKELRGNCEIPTVEYNRKIQMA